VDNDTKHAKQSDAPGRLTEIEIMIPEFKRDLAIKLKKLN